MSTEVQVQVHIEQVPEVGLIYCPNCGFEIPETLKICWKCGERLKK